MILLTLLGCLELDAFVFGGVHCSTVGPETCTDDPWDAICLPCDSPYEWDRSYPWFDTMLAPGEGVRPIPSSVPVGQVLASRDGLAELDTWFVPSHGEVPALARTTILYNHGNYAGIEHYLPLFYPDLETIFDYAGVDTLIAFD